MNKNNKNELGFGIAGLVLVLVVVALIGVTGLLVYKHQTKTAIPSIPASSTKSIVKSPKISTVNNVQTLMNGHVSYEMPTGFTTTKEGYANTNHACGQTIDGATCLDYITLFPSTEHYLDNYQYDQFHITIGVFSSNNILDATDWYTHFVSPDLGTVNPFTTIQINNNSAIYLDQDLSNGGPAESAAQLESILYGVVAKDYGVLVTSDLYKGNYAGVTNTIDFHQYKPVIDALAKSIRFK